MSQDVIFAMIAAFGPLRTVDLKRMRFGRQSVHDALRVMQHTEEIERLPVIGGRPSAFWVAK
jgi:hypothetical protein